MSEDTATDQKPWEKFSPVAKQLLELAANESAPQPVMCHLYIAEEADTPYGGYVAEQIKALFAAQAEGIYLSAEWQESTIGTKTTRVKNHEIIACPDMAAQVAALDGIAQIRGIPDYGFPNHHEVNAIIDTCTIDAELVKMLATQPKFNGRSFFFATPRI